MKDASLKESLYRHFRAQGWYSLIEVPVYNPSGTAGSKYLITDIDVLALRPSVDLSWEFVIGDCKTRKGESPANRTLWVRALMEQFNARRGVLLLRREGRAIESDHRLLAHANRIALLDERDFDIYDKAMLYPGGSGAFHESVAALAQIRQELPERFPKLVPLARFINVTAWNEREHYAVLRLSFGAGSDVRTEIDPGRADHLAFVLEAAGVFAVALATCVGDVFHQYLQPNDRASLEHALRVLVWGGQERYEQVSRLWRELAEAKSLPEERRNALGFPEWEAFLELVRNMLDAPHLAFQVPQVLRAAALAVFEAKPSLNNGTKFDPMLLRLAMLAATFYAQACRFPPETKTRLRAVFIPALSNAVELARASETADNLGKPVARANETAGNLGMQHSQVELPGLEPDKGRRSVVLTDREAADRRAKEAVAKAHQTMSRNMQVNKGNLTMAFRRGLREAVAELSPRLIEVYAQLDGSDEERTNDELVAEISRLVTSFISSSLASQRGDHVAAARREAAEATANAQLAIKNSFELAVHEQIKARNAATSPRAATSSVVYNHHYTNTGIANVVGPDGVASGNTNNMQIMQQMINLDDPRIADELSELRKTLAAETNHDEDAIIEASNVVSAQKALKAGDEGSFRTAMKRLGEKAWSVAEKLALAWMTTEGRRLLGLPPGSDRA